MPSSNASPAPSAIDFVTALGRLLRDGTLRDAYSADATALADRLSLRASDRTRFLQLAPNDLEFQAHVLLKKRFVLVGHALPRTCENIGAQAWPIFRRFARTHTQVERDAVDFCTYLAGTDPTAVCPLEWNRVRRRAESQSRRVWSLAVYPALISARQQRWPQPVLQVFFREREWQFSLGKIHGARRPLERTA